MKHSTTSWRGKDSTAREERGRIYAVERGKKGGRVRDCVRGVSRKEDHLSLAPRKFDGTPSILPWFERNPGIDLWPWHISPLALQLRDVLGACTRASFGSQYCISSHEPSIPSFEFADKNAHKDNQKKVGVQPASTSVLPFDHLEGNEFEEQISHRG